MIDMAYTWELLRITFAAFFVRPRQLLITATLSFLQSGLFFAFWCVFLSRIRNIAGWDIHDMAVFTAVNEISYCLTYILAQGIYHLARTVITGEMDTYLVRPKHPLTQIVVRSSSNYGPGGLAFGLFLLFWYGGLKMDQFGLALLASMILAVLLVALVILFDSLIFFLKSDAACDSLFGMMNTLGGIPQHTQHGVVKFLLYTVLPAGFIAVTPVEVVRHESLPLLCLLLIAAIGYMALALWVFQRGLRRYTSATGWSA